MLFLKTIVYATAFLLEVAMMVGLCYYGLHSGAGIVLKYVLAVALPLAAAVLWSIWAAPKSARRIVFPYRVLFAFGMFLLTAILLYQTGQRTWAIIFASVGFINAILTLVFERKFISK